MPRPSSLVAPALTRHQFDSPKALPGVDVDEQPVEHALAVLAPGVGDGGARQLPDALRLVDVPVQAHHRLVLTIASRVAVLPTGTISRPPTPTRGRRYSSSLGATSSPLSSGGTWRLRIARSMRFTPAAVLSIRSARSRSGMSRGHAQGVGLP